METMTENRAAREIVELMGEKVLFAYQPGMEITVPESDCRSSLDKIAIYHRECQFALSDLYIGYAVSLYRYTIPKVIAATIQVLGNYWPQKNVPKNIGRDALLNRIKKMCSMGMLRRFKYDLNGNTIVLYSTTPEFSKVIYQALKMNTDARAEKDIIPPLEIMEKAAASLVSSEILKSRYMKTFNFMPDFRDAEGRIIFNSRITCEISGKLYTTVIEPVFTRLDVKRFTKEEWEHHMTRKIQRLKAYIDEIEEKNDKKAQLIIVCEDLNDFRKVSTMICNIFPENRLDQIYYTAEGSLKSANYDITQSLVRITSVKHTSGMKLPESVSAQPAYQFF